MDKNVAENVANTSNFQWLVPKFEVKWADSPSDVPEYDLTRFSDFEKLSIDTETWSFERDGLLHLISDPPSEELFPRLVIDTKSTGVIPKEIVSSDNLLKDIRSLYSLAKKSPETPDSPFRKKVIELANLYTPFVRFDFEYKNLNGLTLKSWEMIAHEAFIWQKFVEKLNEHNSFDDISKWTKKELEKALKKQQIYAVPVWKHINNAYLSSAADDILEKVIYRHHETLSDVEMAQIEELKRYRGKEKITNEWWLRRKLAADLRARLGSRTISIQTLKREAPTTNKISYRMVCEVGIYEWISLKIAEKLPTKGYIKICEICGKTFKSTRFHTKTCGNTCRSKKLRLASLV